VKKSKELVTAGDKRAVGSWTGLIFADLTKSVICPTPNEKELATAREQER
jgi:hypothetical protein